MPFLKENIGWIAPTAAILLVGGVYLESEGAIRWPGQETAMVAEKIEPSEVERLNSAVQSAIIETATAPVQTSTEQEVSRTATPDLLEIVPNLQPAAAPIPAVPEVDTEAAASFFNDAQSRLAVADNCAEDLRALAAQTRVYFPSGGLTGEASGIDAARLVGMVASKCSGYSLRVEGHSDPSGNPIANERLSLQRAEAVVSRIAAMGVDTSDFVAVGLGDTRPSSVVGPEARAYYDRRVEFSVVPTATRASFSARVPTIQSALPGCASELAQQAQLLRQFYDPGAITVPGKDINSIVALASDVARCDGARLRIFGHFTDDPGTRETPATARLRALVVMSALVGAGLPSEQILVAAPSRATRVPGQPGLPKSRVDFQVVAD